MFTLDNGPRKVWWPVKISVPVDGGKIEKTTCQILFTLLNEDDQAEIKQITDADAAQSMLVKHIHDWKDIADTSGEPVAFNRDNLMALLKIPYFSKSVVFALTLASSGIAEAGN